MAAALRSRVHRPEFVPDLGASAHGSGSRRRAGRIGHLAGWGLREHADVLCGRDRSDSATLSGCRGRGRDDAQRGLAGGPLLRVAG
jgi:hypothetical protein